MQLPFAWIPHSPIFDDTDFFSLFLNSSDAIAFGSALPLPFLLALYSAQASGLSGIKHDFKGHGGVLLFHRLTGHPDKKQSSIFVVPHAFL